MKFEIPFNLNFDGQWFNLLEKNIDKIPLIDCVYVSCFESAHNTREEIRKFPITEEQYKEMIEKIKSYGLIVNILIQKDATLELIESYINNYDIKDFTINDDELAKQIKAKYPDVTLRLSLTRKATVDELNTLDLSMYDNVNLFFWYNRHLTITNSLPKERNYTILCNTSCLWNCPWTDQHWFEGKTSQCYSKRFTGIAIDMQNTAYILPTDLDLFEVSTAKIEGRESSSKSIFDTFNYYVNKKNYKRVIRYDNDVYNII